MKLYNLIDNNEEEEEEEGNELLMWIVIIIIMLIVVSAEEEECEDPQMESVMIQHTGAINRIRVITLSMFFSL